MHVMFMAQCYAPENVSAPVLITELAVDLVARGHQVTFITAAPSYPEGKVFPGYRNRFYQVEWLDGVRVVRTWSYISPSKATIPRLLHYGTYSATAFYGGLFAGSRAHELRLAGKPDIIMSYSPPLPLGLSAWLLSRLWHVPWVLQIEDLYPDAAVAAGLMHDGPVVRFFSAVERFLYRHADRISVISESFRLDLLGKDVPAEKISLIPVWADPDVVRPMPMENAFRQRLGLTGKMVVMYAGNLGLTSCLEDVLVAAKLLKDEAGIRFVIVGEGVKKDALKATAQEAELDNIIFLPYQPRELFPEMMAAADVSLVTLNSGSASSSLPSKIFNVMASARPILAVAPIGSEISHLVGAGRCGVVVPPDCPALLAETVQELRGEPGLLAEMGRNGRVQLENAYSRVHCVDAFEKLLGEVCGRGAGPQPVRDLDTRVSSRQLSGKGR